MAKTREEIVGKRFLSVSSGSKLKLSKINEWDWRAGVIRACTHADSKHHDLQVLVEYDDVEWQRREWVHVYRGQVFQIFLLERTLAWASRKHPSKIRAPPILWPALVYMPLVDQAGISEHKYRPVEYLVDRSLDYHDYSQVQPYQDGDITGVCGEECMRAVRAWVGEQDGQRILLTTPSVLVGFRVQVYRSEGTTQWYTAVIVGYNDSTRELTVTDDTVLEEHSEDPSLVQIRLIGEGVVESILRGENVGITPRRSRTATNNHHQSGVRHIRRDGVVPARGRKNSLTRPNNLPPTASHTLPPNTTHTHLPVAIHSLTPKTSAAAPSHLNSSSSSSTSLSSSSSSTTLSREEDIPEVQPKEEEKSISQNKSEPFQSHVLKGQHLKQVTKNRSNSPDTEKVDDEVKQEDQAQDEKSEEDLDKGTRKTSLSSPRQSASPLQSNNEEPHHSKETTPLQTIKEKPLVQIKEKPPEHEAEQQPNKQIKEASKQPAEKNFQKVKDNFSQEIKEEPLRQIKEKPPEQVHSKEESKEKEKDKISTKKIVNDNKPRKIKEQNPQQVKVLLTRHSRNQLRESIKEPLLNPSKKSDLQNHDEILEIFSEKDTWQKKKLITRQTKEILTRQAKEQLSRQTKVLLTRPLKDQLPKDYKKELAKRDKINRSLKGADQDSPKVQLVKIDEALSSSASRKTSKEDNYSPKVKEEVKEEDKPQRNQVLGSERVEKEAFPTKRKETLLEIKDPTPHPPKKEETFHSKKDSKTKATKDTHKKENREDTKYLIKEEKCYSIASDPLLLKIIKEGTSSKKTSAAASSSSSSVASSCASSPLPSQQPAEETEQPPPPPPPPPSQRNKKDTSHRTSKEEQQQQQPTHKKKEEDDDEEDEEEDNNIKGKSVAVGVRWKKRRQGSITSETSSGEEEQRPVRERRSLRATPDSVSRVLTRLEKQNSVENSKNTSGSNSSSSSSTPDHRPLRRTHKNSSRVQNLLNLGHIEAKVNIDSIGSSTDSSISKTNKSDTNYSGSNNCSSSNSSSSNTSASSTSTSSSSTPEPELPSRPPSQRVAALRHQKLISHRLRGGKRGKNRAFQRNKQRWRSVSPFTSTESSTELSLTQRSPKNKNNDENINSTNCDDNSTKSQKRKYNTPNKLASKNDNCNPSREILHDIKDPLVEKSQHCPNKETPKETAPVSDSESAEDPIVVVYEKTNFKNRTPVAKSESESRLPATRRVSVNVSKTVVSGDNEIPNRINNYNKTVEPDPQKKTIVPSSGCDENGKSSDTLNKDSVSNSTTSIVPSVTDNTLPSKCVPKNSLVENKSSGGSGKPIHVSESESDDGNSKPSINVSPSNQDNFSQSSFQNSGPFKAKSPPRTLIADALISSDEGPDDEVKRKLVTSVDLIVESLKDESEGESYGQSDKDLSVKSALNSSLNLQTSTPLDIDSLPCTCVCNTSSVSDSIITTTSVVSKLSVSKDIDQQNVSVLQGTDDDSISVISSHYNTSDKSAGSDRDVKIVEVSSTAAVSGSVNTVSIVTSVTSANSESVVPGTTSAIVSPSQAVSIGRSLDNSRVNISNTSGSGCSSSSNSCSINSDSYNTSRDCVEVAGVVSGRAVTITATSGPGPTCSTRVASPPSVSITAVVRSPAAHLQPANPDPAYPAPHHHDGVPHTSLHHQLQPANPHPHHHHQHYQQVQQHQSQQQLSTASATTRMDHCDGSSDSGVSVTERSVSRSSVLSDDRSSSAEVKPNTPTPITASQIKTSQAPLLLDRKESVRVYRDPSLLSQSEHTVRHIHSVQHTSMSQHYPGVPPLHHAPPTGTPGSGGSHAPGHHGSHGQPPSSLPHGLPPSLHYPAHPAAAAAGVPPPMHLPPGLQQPLPPGIYPHDVWKLGPVPAIPQHAYASLLTPHQEELMHLERAREMDRERAERDRILRREAEAREKERAAKEKMERERNERERREREERERREKERREREEKERQQYQVDQHFNKSFRLAQQKHGGENVRQMPADHLNQAYYVHGLPNHHPSNHPSHNHSLLMTQHTKAYQAQAHAQKVTGWNPLGGLVKPDRGIDVIEERRLFEQRQEEAIRRVHEPEKMVHESIHKAFRTMDRSNDPQGKMRHPPPAHASSKPQSEKAVVSAGLPKIAEPSFNLSYPPNYLAKDAKLTHSAERVPYPHYPDPRDKASVIIQPEKYERGPPHSISPKQRPPERSSPYPPGSAYKTHDPSPSSLHRSSTSHHPSSSLPHNIETKPRQPQSSPISTPSPAHTDRYYTPPGAKPPPTTYPSSLITAGLVPNPLHVSSVTAKTKVSSPPPQLYGKPGITTGTPVCRVDSRPSQPIPLTSKATVGGPPPAHSGRGSHSETRPPLPSHEQRTPLERGPYDARIYPPTVPSPHHKHVVAPGPPPTRIPPVSSPHIATPHIPPHPSPQPTQTQPLDLGTREDTASPSKRRTQTPTPQDPKKARYETSNNQPLLARVSEPSPLYPSAATTITTVENTVALAANLSRVSSPASRPPSQPPAATTPTLQRTENSSSPGANKMTEPEKSSSPGPASGYVHKLKKAWLQRHESGVEIIPAPTSTSSPSLSTRVSTPPPASSTPASSKSVTTTTTTLAVKSEPKSVVRKPKVMNSIHNGHREDIKDGDTSSTDSEGSTTQKNKRGSKGKRKFKKPKRGSDSNSDSDKDSDASETNAKNPGRIPSKSDSEPKKRGRKPKTKQEKEKEEGPKPKKSKEEPPQNDPLQKPPVSQLKKTGESFLQDGSCYEVAPKLPKCRECRWTAHQRNKKMPNIFCRFYAFRRLRYTKNGQLAVAGFSDPIKDVSADDLKLWVPDSDSPPEDLDVETSKFLLTHVGDQFCDLVEQEKEAMALHMGEDNTVAWKRVVQGVREMCDVCETTLFNIHWACSKCGFVVCIDCYKGRKNGTVKVWDDGGKDRDEYSWLLCASRLPHEQDKLMLTQIISGNALIDLGNKVHEVRHQWNIPQYCDCPEAKKYKDQAPQDDKKKVNGVNKDLLKNIKKESKDQLVNGMVKQEISDKTNCKDEEMSNSPLNFFADVALSSDKRESESSDSDSDSDSDDKEGNFSTLRELLIRPNAKPNGTKDENGGSTKPNKDSSKKKPKLETVDDVISCVIEQSPDKDDAKDNNQVVLKHFIRKYNYGPRGRDPLPIRIMTKTESSLLYPGVAHSWLCDGKLLRLLDPLAPNNTSIFQDQWKRGQPVIVSGVGQKLNLELWKPQSFSKDYGDIKNDLINCLTGNIVPNQPMKKFWDGFENYGKRLKDEKGQPMVLKLKDWPPGDDFAEMLPSRFEDLMSVLPMGEYTRRNGRLNLAGRLPECFVRPDLGPKMYIAYGSAIHPSKASTNLHLDISDAVNVMCYVGIPKDADYEEHIKEALKAIDEAGCDILTRRRVREKDEVPGALWHIYHARDADKIRDLLNKVAIERGDKLEPHHDPIHDQSWYLDGLLRDRLYKEYGVEGYAIIQCYGDAVFIPAGAPHQVRNLHNCVKVAEDFVSPENIAYCFHLTQEFRHLSDTHTNHEDKLQIKNIIYHDMKDSLACLMAASKELQRKSEVKEEVEKTVKKEPES